MRFVLLVTLVLSLTQFAFAQPLLLVLNKVDNELAIIDPDAMKIIAKVETGLGPHEVCATSDGKYAIVANYGDAKTVGHSLSVIDLATKKVLRVVDTSPLKRPHGLAEADGKVWFTSETSAVVGRYDPATDKVDAIIGTGQGLSHMVVRDAKSGKIFTANIMSDSVTMLETKGQHPKPVQIAVHKEPEGIAISPDGASVWVGHRKGGDIVVIDTKTKEVTQTIACGGVPIRLAFTPDGKRVLVSEAEVGNVLVFDAATFKEIGRVPVGNTPVGILATPDSKRAFVAITGEGKVVCVDLETMKVTRSLETGNQPDGVAWAEGPK
jgi:YVTN family beta-propeller protein